MSRYIGPKHKLCRRLGMKVCDSAKCPSMRRSYPPGVHGPLSKQRLTPYGQQFREKQRARRIYGVNERQFNNYYQKAIQEPGDTGLHLARMLEMRLDNVVYRLRWALTRPQARQMVNHGFVMVNGKKVDIASYEVRVKDVVTVKPNKQKKKIFEDISKRLEKQTVPDWLNSETSSMQAKVLSAPDPELLKGLFNAQAVVELYSR